MLVHVTKQLAVDPSAVPYLDGDLVRSGAWDAHFTGEGGMTVAVIAASQLEAAALVDKLLARVLPAIDDEVDPPLPALA